MAGYVKLAGSGKECYDKSRLFQSRERNFFMGHKLTKKDIEDMQKELDYRKLVVRPEALDEVRETRAQGDLSENFEYHEAKRAKNRNEGRIRYLERMIKTADLIEESAAEDEVSIGKTVTIYIPEDDEEEVYTLVSTIRKDALNGLISVESPMGRALLGRRAGDLVQVRVDESYSYEAVIRKVEYTGAGESAEIRKY